MTPTLLVPPHIIRPAYVGKSDSLNDSHNLSISLLRTDNPNPVFGIYSGRPVVHNKEVADSKSEGCCCKHL